MISATEMNAFRLEIMDGVNQLLKLPLISYVIDNTKTMINQVIVHCTTENIATIVVQTYNIIATAFLHCFIFFFFLVCVVLRIHRLKQKNTKHYSQTSESIVRSDVYGSRQRNEVRPVTVFVYSSQNMLIPV